MQDLLTKKFVKKFEIFTILVLVTYEAVSYKKSCVGVKTNKSLLIDGEYLFPEGVLISYQEISTGEYLIPRK